VLDAFSRRIVGWSMAITLHSRLQHLGILVGRQALARVWPEIISWLNTQR
jgi:hypothetical protein